MSVHVYPCETTKSLCHAWSMGSDLGQSVLQWFCIWSLFNYHHNVHCDNGTVGTVAFMWVQDVKCFNKGITIWEIAAYAVSISNHFFAGHLWPRSATVWEINRTIAIPELSFPWSKFCDYVISFMLRASPCAVMFPVFVFFLPFCLCFSMFSPLFCSLINLGI